MPTHSSYACRMARLFSSSQVISFFSGEDDEVLSEVIFPGSDDELGMEEEDDDSEPEFEPLEVHKGYKNNHSTHAK